MKKLLAILFILCPLFLGGQTLPDQEMQSLVRSVCKLRASNKAVYEQVASEFKADELWTPMNETNIHQDEECLPSDKVPGFKLNRILRRILSDEKYVSTRGEFLNGEDLRYDYSLYEHSVYAGKTVTYTLKKRKGAQWLVLVPYEKQGGGLKATVQVNGGEKVEFTPLPKLGEGVMAVFLDKQKLPKEPVLTIAVTGGPRNQSFVILNHNTRK